MKKILVLLMILALVFSSVACGGAGSTGGGGKQEGIKIAYPFGAPPTPWAVRLRQCLMLLQMRWC